MVTRNGQGVQKWIDALRGVGTSAAVWVKNRRGTVAPRWIGVLAAGVVLALLVVTRNISFSTGFVALSLIVAASFILARLLEAAPDDEDRLATRHSLQSWNTSRSSEQSAWRSVVDAIPTAALALDQRAVVVHQNKLVADLFPKLSPGIHFSSVVRYPELLSAIDTVLNTREPVVVEFIERVPIERRISATLSKLEQFGPGSRGPALLITFRDLTEHDRLTQMRADFIAYASHELRTPVASLQGFVETLQGPARDDPDARDRFLGLMASQASRMTRLIDDLLSLSRLEMRAHLHPRGIVDLGEVVDYVVQTLEPLAQASRVTISVQKLQGLARIRGDRDEIVQVMQNLVHNAIKYGKDGGRVDVRVFQAQDQQPGPSRFTVEVRDDGAGIPAEHLPRLTERFYRVNKSQSRERGGTGLGLAIVKHIVVRHHGELGIASRAGEGATFSVTFDELGTSGVSSP